jgi:type IX secretion system PorP/SprF family membrane protein
MATIFVILLALVARAQQDAMYSQYMFNMMAVNPAYAGSREVLSVTGMTRAQWVGMEGAPVSNTVSLDVPIKSKRVGLGLQLFNDKIGVTSNNGLYASYAYRIQFERSTLSFGLQGGIIHFNANYAQLNLNNAQDKVLQQNASVWIPSAGAGIYLSDDRYYLGASLPNLFSTQLSTGTQVQVNKYDHLFLMGGYVFKLSPDYRLKPSALLKAVKGAPAQLDVNLNFWMYDIVGLGVSYRSGDASVGMVEIQVTPSFRVGYAYDYSMGALRQFHSGSHELMLRYEFGYSKDKIVTPRYF